MTPNQQPRLCPDHKPVLGNFKHLRAKRSSEVAMVRRWLAFACPDCCTLNGRTTR